MNYWDSRACADGRFVSAKATISINSRFTPILVLGFPFQKIASLVGEQPKIEVTHCDRCCVFSFSREMNWTFLRKMCHRRC